MSRTLAQELPLFVAQLEVISTQRPATRRAKPFWSSLSFISLLKSQLRHLAGPGTDELAQAAIESYEQGIKLARLHQLEAARQHLSAVDADVTSYPGALQEFLTVFGLSAWAYYFYKLEQWPQALTALTQVLHTSASLEHQGYYALSSRRRLTLTNIVRVYEKQGDQAAGDKLLRGAVRFFHSGQARNLLIADWEEKSFARIPALREFDFQSLMSSIVRRNTEQLSDPTYHNAYYAAFFYRELLAQLAITNYARQTLREWLMVKVICPEHEPRTFLAGVLAFLSQPAIEQYAHQLEINLLTHIQLLIDEAPGLDERDGLRQRVGEVAKLLAPAKKPVLKVD